MYVDNIQLDIQGMNINELLETNEIQVRIGTTWYRLDEIGPVTDNGTLEPVFPIMVSDEDGESFEYDMADIDEFDPVFTLMDRNTIGMA